MGYDHKFHLTSNFVNRHYLKVIIITLLRSYIMELHFSTVTCYIFVTFDILLQ